MRWIPLDCIRHVHGPFPSRCQPVQEEIRRSTFTTKSRPTRKGLRFQEKGLRQIGEDSLADPFETACRSLSIMCLLKYSSFNAGLMAKHLSDVKASLGLIGNRIFNVDVYVKSSLASSDQL